MSQGFKYERLFASSAPPANLARAFAPRVRYDFAVAYPDPDSLPLEGLWQAAREALRREGRDLALYPQSRGNLALRELIADKLARDRGMKVSTEEITLANGSMQAITLLFEVFLEPGDIVLTERFFYLGTLRALRRFKADIIGIPTDEDGMLMDELEKALKRLASEGKRPKFIYTIPAYQNPDGSVLSLERRKRMLELSREHGIPVIEDDCYVDLRYEGEMPPAMHSMDADGRVMYLSSFSKIVAPGVRLGWVVAPEEVTGRILAIKLDGGPNEFASLVVRDYLRKEMYPHIAEINGIQRVKRDAMLSALGENFPLTCRWSKPKGGLYIWLELPLGADTVKLQEAALKEGVGYISGVTFSPADEGKNFLRLCFGYNTPEEIREGVKILARVAQREGMLDPKHKGGDLVDGGEC